MFARSCPFVGFIQDLDHGELVLREGEEKMKPEIERSLKDITGTFQFMALEVLSSNGDIKHEVKHDLEGSAACSELFDHDNNDLAAAVKLQFLSTTKRLSQVQSIVEVTYEMLLEAIEDHLGMDGWPLDDAAITFIDPSSSGVAQGTAHPSGSQQLPGSSDHRFTSKRKRRSATKRMPQDISSSEETAAAEIPVDRTSRWSRLRKYTKPVKRYRPEP
ncbi:hypothetical protein PILCRDRAFT_12517 [Piloderma croceum F 1598]|uniref:Fungal-type protein kinase domain-containing protein n=1 Tax=Piloderma croceum (strain F 1598) TaxID=765440 RepID=A0A0C3FAP2_PILCF|nr:hypothetical protein PILCRDRAFT_12517 [Piloderma croceum F 1598]